MPDEEYWKGRFEALSASLLEDGMDYYDDAERLFRKAQNAIDGDIAVWYQRFAENNKITLQEAQKWLRDKELKEFQWTVEDYIARGKENGVSADWSKELENASARVHITRLEALKVQIQQHLEELYGNYLDGLDSAMRQTYQEGYYRTAYTMQEGFHTGFDVAALPESAVDAVIRKPWAADGANFSDRVWKDKEKLLRTLHDELTQGLIRGDAQDAIVRRFHKRMGTSLSSAGRLIATESAFFASKGELDNMKELGVEKYQFLATLDSRTSDICRSMDMKIIPMKDFQPGVTAPPLHCWCRSCTVPYMKEIPEGLRAARDEKGKTVTIPDMSYADWKAIYVDQTKTLEEWAASRKPKQEEKPQTKDVPKKISFTPAKSIEEAQAYAAQFIDDFTGYGTPFKGVANYKGISLDMANAVNEALTQVFGTLNLPKLGGLKVVSSKSAQGKKAFSGESEAVASYNAAGRGIFLNKEVLKNAKALETYNQREKEAWEYIRKNRSLLNKKQEEMFRKYEEAGRSLVSGDTVQGLVTHELGHHVQFEGLTTKQFNEMTARRKQYDGKISGYAQESGSEYIAESFVAYMKGEKSILDPEFVKVLDGMLKQPKKADIIKEKVASGEISLTVNPEKQGRHDRSSKLYQDGRSYMTISMNEIQDIVNRYAGTGFIPTDKNGEWKRKETIVVPKEIGVVVDRKTNREIPTNRLTIHYSKTGVHLVPSEKKMGGE